MILSYHKVIKSLLATYLVSLCMLRSVRSLKLSNDFDAVFLLDRVIYEESLYVYKIHTTHALSLNR
jgi:hypothetical protein